MKKNILNLYEGFFDDLDQLKNDLNKNKKDKKNDDFGDVNSNIYDQHDFILSQNRNPEFFEGLCNMCKDYYSDLPSNENGFTQEDLNQITCLFTSKDNNYNSYFEKITSLDELQFFNNLKEIKAWGFCGCKKLKSVIFPKNLEKLYDNCFSDCFSLKKLKFPDSIKEIYKYSFNYCTSLKEILFPKNIEIIENLAFKNCFSLKKIVIPKRFKSLMEYIFDNVDLSKVDITYI